MFVLHGTQRTQCTSVFVHIVDSLHGLIFNDCLFFSIVNMGYVHLIPVLQPLNKVSVFKLANQKSIKHVTDKFCVSKI